MVEMRFASPIDLIFDQTAHHLFSGGLWIDAAPFDLYLGSSAANRNSVICHQCDLSGHSRPSGGTIAELGLAASKLV